MPGLAVLALGDNPFFAPTDAFPEEVTKLTNRAVHVGGVIPPGIGDQLLKLTDLELSDNTLHGEIPNLDQLLDELYNNSLRYLDASANRLTGMHGGCDRPILHRDDVKSSNILLLQATHRRLRTRQDPRQLRRRAAGLHRRLDGAPAGRPDDGGGRPGAAGRRVLCTSRTPSMQMLEDAAIGRDYGTVN
jgi:hypothetical protein